MVSNFNFNDGILNLAIYLGLDQEKAKENYFNIQEDSKSFRDEALESYNKNFCDHVENLKMNSSFEKILKIFNEQKENLKDIKITAALRKDITRSFKKLSEKEIKKEKENVNVIVLFFNRVGHLIRLHGFVTDGEWGVKLAKEVEAAEMEIIRGEFTAFISGQGSSPEKIKEFAKKINGLDKNLFLEFLKKSFFTTKSSSWIFNHKFNFFNNLSEEKKSILVGEMLSRKDWFDQIADMTKIESIEDINEIISNEMIAKFQESYKSTISNVLKRSVNYKHSNESLLKVLVQRSLQKDLKDKNSTRIDKLLRFLFDSDLKLSNDEYAYKLATENKILTENELDDMKTQVEFAETLFE